MIDYTDSRAVPENPLSYGGRWALYRSDHGATDRLALYSNGGGHNVITCDSQAVADPQQAHYYWTPQSFTGDCEIWCYFSSQGGWDDGASLAVGFVRDVGTVNGAWNGWHARHVNTFSFAGWELFKITAGSASLVTSQSGFGVESAGDLILFRRKGSDLEIWRSLDDGTTWDNAITWTDSAFQTGMYLSVGSSVQSITNYPGIYNVGGGIPPEFTPQIYRRPNE